MLPQSLAGGGPSALAATSIHNRFRSRTTKLVLHKLVLGSKLELGSKLVLGSKQLLELLCKQPLVRKPLRCKARILCGT